MRAVICCMLDEDSVYLLRFSTCSRSCFRDQEKYRIEFHKHRAYWDWEEVMRHLTMHDRKWVEHEAES